MKTWQFVLGFTVVGLAVVQLATWKQPEAGTSLVQLIEETEQVDGGLRAIVTMHAPASDVAAVKAIAGAMPAVARELQATGDRYNEVVFAVSARADDGAYGQAYSVFYHGRDLAMLASARGDAVYEVGEPGLVTPVGRTMLQAYCQGNMAGAFCRKALK